MKSRLSDKNVLYGIRLFADRGCCPLCGSDSYSVHIGFPDISVHQCEECTLMYSGRILTRDQLHDYYQNTFGSPRHRQGQVVNAKANLVALSKLMDLSKVRSLLDVGTGYGFLLKALQDQYHIKGKGVELSKQEARYAIENLGLDVFPGSLADAVLAQESFDVVACFEVIEHVPRPVEFIAELAAHVRPGCKIVVMTDNFASWACRALGPEFPKWIPHTHISHFTPRTLARCIESVAGLRIEQFLSYTPPELVARVVLSLCRRRKPAAECFNLAKTLSSEMTGSYRFFHIRKLLIKLWFRATFMKNPNGALMFAVAQKG